MPIGIYKRTEKIKKALSESHKGLTGWWRGKHQSEEGKRKMEM